MELLSLSLILVPSSNHLPEILGAWRRCDEELNALHGREVIEEDIWDTKGDILHSGNVPGGFGPSDYERDAIETEHQRAKRSSAGGGGVGGRGRLKHSTEEEAPMGLFDVARGAAMAFKKNAFPLHHGVGTVEHDHGHDHGSGDVGDSGSGSGMEHSTEGIADDEELSSHHEDGRVRKRDVVSNMVTGGLVSGIGWVLGAEPVNHNNHHGHK